MDTIASIAKILGALISSPPSPGPPPIGGSRTTRVYGEKVTLRVDPTTQMSMALLQNPPVPGTVQLYYAGLRFVEGVEYTVTGNILNFKAGFPINPDDPIFVDYEY